MLVVRMLGVGKRLWVVRIIEVVRMEWGGDYGGVGNSGMARMCWVMRMMVVLRIRGVMIILRVLRLQWVMRMKGW